MPHLDSEQRLAELEAKVDRLIKFVSRVTEARQYVIEEWLDGNETPFHKSALRPAVEAKLLYGDDPEHQDEI